MSSDSSSAATGSPDKPKSTSSDSAASASAAPSASSRISSSFKLPDFSLFRKHDTTGPSRSEHFIGFDDKNNVQIMRNSERKLSASEISADEREFRHCEAIKQEAVEKVLEPKKFIQCVPCQKGVKFQASMQYGEDGNVAVWICQNLLSGKRLKHMQRSVTHELIHAYDHCRAHVDFADCRHLSCTEIRAANLSTDCLWTNELRRGVLSITDQHKKCVRRRAYESVVAHPNCPPDKARDAIKEVWQRCYSDTEPFGSQPY